MARNSNQPKIGYTMHERIVIDDFWKTQNEPVYCGLCGGEILKFAGIQESEEATINGRRVMVHRECFLRYNREQAEKAEQEAIRRAREIEEKRRLEDAAKQQNQ